MRVLNTNMTAVHSKPAQCFAHQFVSFDRNKTDSQEDMKFE